MYDLIYADCPWKYDRAVGQGIACERYQVMGHEDIAALPISQICAADAICFMWATFPKLIEALYVMEKWGFKYRTVAFNWVKTNKCDGKPFFGIGTYAKSDAEICLLGTKGKTLRPAVNTVSSVIISPRRRHSQKPDEARDRIVQMYPDLKKIELFARERVEGWDAIGYDIDGRDIREVLAA